MEWKNENAQAQCGRFGQNKMLVSAENGETPSKVLVLNTQIPMAQINWLVQLGSLLLLLVFFVSFEKVNSFVDGSRYVT